jgi:uncharacterized YigZ family protein
VFHVKQSDRPEFREPTGPASVEFSVRKSRFLGYGFAACSGDEATTRIRSLRLEHAGADHVVHAYIVGLPTRELESYSDAGEPHGTAGRPVMEILRGSPVRNAGICVVRYFGGTKLGTGGLVRAYGNTARAVLDNLPTRPLVQMESMIIRTDYHFHSAVSHAIRTSHATITAEQFETGVTVLVSCPLHSVEGLAQVILDASAGTAIVEIQRPNSVRKSDTRER